MPLVADFYVKANDDDPDVSGVATARGVPVDLTDATALFQVRPAGSPTAPAVLVATAVPDPDQVANPGLVVYSWADDDLDLLLSAPGFYLAEFKITFLDGGRLRVPNDGFLLILVSGNVA